MSRVSNQAIAGLIVVAIGVLLLIGTLDVVDLGTVARWIPSLFILLGLWRLVASGFTNVLGPFIIIAVAALVQLAVLGVDIGQWWPILLIILGLGMLLGWQRVRGVERQSASTNSVNAVGIFGGPTLRVSSQGFKGGQVTAFMGGVNLDLREARVPDRPAVIDATVIFGGADIKVPPQWNVKLDALTLFGGSEDERRQPAGVSGDGTPDLVITGLVLFGGISIKD